MNKQIIPIIVLIVMIVSMSLLFAMSCGDFSLYEWSGVPLPGKGGLTDPHIFYVEGQQLWMGPLPPPEQNALDGLEQVFNHPDLAAARNLVINRSNNFLYWARNNIIFGIEIGLWNNREEIINYTGGNITHFNLNENNNTIIFTTDDDDSLKKGDAIPNGSYSSFFNDPDLKRPYDDLVFDSNDGADGSLFVSHTNMTATFSVSRIIFSTMNKTELILSNVPFIGLHPDMKRIFYLENTMQLRSTDYTGGLPEGPFGFSVALASVSEMVIDYLNNKVYFAEDTTPTSGRILRAPLTGGTTLTVHNEPNNRITALAVFIP